MDTHPGEDSPAADTPVADSHGQVGSHRADSPAVDKKCHSPGGGRKDHRDMQEGSHRHRRQAEILHICSHSEQHKDRMPCHDTSAQRVRKQKHTNVIPRCSLCEERKQKQMEDVPLQILCFLCAPPMGVCWLVKAPVAHFFSQQTLKLQPELSGCSM